MRAITTDEVLSHLVARSAAPSSMGAQLERLKYGITAPPDPFRARDEAEAQMFVQAELLRCIDEFASVPEFRPTTPRGPAFKALEKVQRGTSPKMCQGAIALGVLQSYQEWCAAVGKSSERGLAAVYAYLRSVAPHALTPLPKDTADVTQSFREGRAKRARAQVSEVYADALLALGQFLHARNKRVCDDS